MFGWLRDAGVKEHELDWFHGNAGADLIDVQGVNYYPQWSYAAALPSGDLLPVNGGVLLLESHIRRFWRKYRMPIMITETSVRGGNWEKSAWLSSSVSCVRRLRSEAISVVGYTWFPVLDMIDWEYRNTEATANDYRMELGLWTLERTERSAAQTYRELIRNGIDG